MAGRLVELVHSAVIGELEKLRDQVKKLARDLDDREFWTRPLAESNSVGHLVLHLTGNLNTLVGAQLGHTGYIRDRDREFNEANPPAPSVALADLDAAVATFRRVVEGLDEEQLLAAHPTERFGQVLPALVTLVAHFALHRGQMSYLTRLIKARR
jgi:hypothetical protein